MAVLMSTNKHPPKTSLTQRFLHSLQRRSIYRDERRGEGRGGEEEREKERRERSLLAEETTLLLKVE